MATDTSALEILFVKLVAKLLLWIGTDEVHLAFWDLYIFRLRSFVIYTTNYHSVTTIEKHLDLRLLAMTLADRYFLQSAFILLSQLTQFFEVPRCGPASTGTVVRRDDDVPPLPAI